MPTIFLNRKKVSVLPDHECAELLASKFGKSYQDKVSAICDGLTSATNGFPLSPSPSLSTTLRKIKLHTRLRLNIELKSAISTVSKIKSPQKNCALNLRLGRNKNNVPKHLKNLDENNTCSDGSSEQLTKQNSLKVSLFCKQNIIFEFCNFTLKFLR